MIRYVNGCAECTRIVIGDCRNSPCDYREKPIYICDKCGSEDSELYYDENGDQLCADCILRKYELVEG